MEEYKILLLGSDRVGKTALFQAITGELIDVTHRPTLVMNIGFKILNLNGKQIGLRIWDLGGQTFLRDAWREYFSKTDGCILIYDITRKYTFDEIFDWKQDLSNNLNRNIPYILVGNKSDLDFERQITYLEGKELQGNLNLNAFFETSALLNINVREVFSELAAFL